MIRKMLPTGRPAVLGAARLVVLSTILLGATVLAGCGSAQVRGTDPEDMSAAEHEAAAEREEDYARGAEVIADPGATPFRLDGPGERARFYRRHAAAHRAAAEALEERHVEACQGLSDEKMATCPFCTGAEITAVEDVPAGVRVRLGADADAEEALAQARCHVAHGALEGRKGMPDCPFYLRGVTVSLDRRGDADWLVITTSEAGEVSGLRARAHALVDAAQCAE